MNKYLMLGHHCIKLCLFLKYYIAHSICCFHVLLMGTWLTSLGYANSVLSDSLWNDNEKQLSSAFLCTAVDNLNRLSHAELPVIGCGKTWIMMTLLTSLFTSLEKLDGAVIYIATEYLLNPKSLIETVQRRFLQYFAIEIRNWNKKFCLRMFNSH